MPTNNRAQMQKVAKRVNGQENLVKRNRRLMTTDTHDDDRTGDGAQLPSQSSSDDGVMATIAQQMQASMDKKKKEKEGKFLQVAQTVLNETLSDKAQEFSANLVELDNIFSDYQLGYAKSEDEIRKVWEQILAEQQRLKQIVEGQYAVLEKSEKHREQEHIQALSHCHKACEDFLRISNNLDPDQAH